jgi:SAM-dependent methyltransferase
MIHADQLARQTVIAHDQRYDLREESMTVKGTEAEPSWEAEYQRGRYQDEPPVPFTDDILRAARTHGCTRGLYVGCGNGRNFVPMSRAGLELTGLDISGTALAQLTARAPESAGRLVHGDLGALADGETYDLVIGIQVFQHGDRATTHSFIAQAQRRLAPGGLFCLRVNAVGTQVCLEHEIIEVDPEDGGFTIRYLAGPKAGLLIHYFSAAELGALFNPPRFQPVLPPRIDQTWREPPEPPGQWSQWEAIWRLVPGLDEPATGV